MSKKISIVIITIILMCIMAKPVFAVETLGISVLSSKNNVDKGEEIEVTVKLSQGMQAADFYIEYNSEVLEYVETEELSSYIGNSNGKLIVSWFSADNKDRTEFKIKMKAKKAGDVQLKLVAENFATGDLEKPKGYDITYSADKKPTILPQAGSKYAFIIGNAVVAFAGLKVRSSLKKIKGV